MTTRRSFIAFGAALLASASAVAGRFVGGTRGADTTPPTLQSAIVSNSTPGRIDLTWSEAMNSTVSAAAAFAVSAGHTLTAHTYTDSTHSYLTTSTDFVNGEAARTLDYTQPGSDKMQDLAGNLLANISAASITNNVAAAASTGSAPNSPSQLIVTGGSGQLTVTWTAPLSNADGSDISSPGLTGYTVYWGPTAGQQENGGSYTGSSSVAAGTLTKTVTGLSAGDWYVGVSATSANGEGYSSPEKMGTVS